MFTKLHCLKATPPTPDRDHQMKTSFLTTALSQMFTGMALSGCLK